MEVKPLPQMPILAQSVDKTARNAFIDVHTRINGLIKSTVKLDNNGKLPADIAANFAPAGNTHHHLPDKNANDAPSTWPIGCYYTAVYDNGFPTAYGTCWTIKLDYQGQGTAITQICQQWPGSDGGPSAMWIRGKRDCGADVWGPWLQVYPPTYQP